MRHRRPLRRYHAQRAYHHGEHRRRGVGGSGHRNVPSTAESCPRARLCDRNGGHPCIALAAHVRCTALDGQRHLKGWHAALGVYRQPRVLSMLCLGFSAGLPFFLVFQTLSAWLRQSGIHLSTIGMLSWVGIVYSIKILWAPIVDRVPLPVLHRLLGRRRSWMLLAQAGIAVGLINMSWSDPAAGVLRIAGWAVFVAFWAATQDIAVDAWRIESAGVQMQGAMAAAYQIGYRIALIIASAGAFT